jgi:hypothetical protein
MTGASEHGGHAALRARCERAPGDLHLKWIAWATCSSDVLVAGEANRAELHTRRAFRPPDEPPVTPTDPPLGHDERTTTPAGSTQAEPRGWSRPRMISKTGTRAGSHETAP